MEFKKKGTFKNQVCEESKADFVEMTIEEYRSLTDELERIKRELKEKNQKINDLDKTISKNIDDLKVKNNESLKLKNSQKNIQSELDNLRNQYKSLSQFVREKSNKANGIQPKKERSGYLIQTTSMVTKKVWYDLERQGFGGDVYKSKKGKMLKTCEIRLITPLNIEMPVKDAETFILSDFERLNELLGFKAMMDVKSSYAVENAFSIALKKVDGIVDYKITRNFKSKRYELTLWTMNYPIDIDKDLFEE
uniref:Uncharacterized protein n=1 Tax=uncultured prokaryote TaxID=198431 RepID=A0A0H5Q4V6_9ZZZZ|nr:hypothetical protein [uncultured prokaryote]